MSKVVFMESMEGKKHLGQIITNFTLHNCNI